MANYDDYVLGVNNPLHPTNEIQVNDEQFLTQEEIWIDAKKEEIKQIKQILSNMERIYNEGNGFLTFLKNDLPQGIDEYVRLREKLAFKINRL